MQNPQEFPGLNTHHPEQQQEGKPKLQGHNPPRKHGSPAFLHHSPWPFVNENFYWLINSRQCNGLEITYWLSLPRPMLQRLQEGNRHIEVSSKLWKESRATCFFFGFKFSFTIRNLDLGLVYLIVSFFCASGSVADNPVG